MRGEVVDLASRKGAGENDLLHRLEGVAAIFQAIDLGELLTVLPECETAQAQYSAAMGLLCIARREIESICLTLRG